MAWLGDVGSAVLGALYANALLAAAGAALAASAVVAVAWRLGWIESARRHPRRSGGLVVAMLAVAMPLAWYLASPLVLSASIDEPPPVIAARSTTVPSTPAPTAVPSTPAPTTAGSSRPTPTAAPSGTPPPIERIGSFHGSDEFHFGRGTARLIEVEAGSYVVRLQDFAVRNGPDLYVYLSPSADGYARGAIELGRLKADTGNQNYTVPAGVLDDPADAASVVIWCKQFSHLFATAPLAG